VLLTNNDLKTLREFAHDCVDRETLAGNFDDAHINLLGRLVIEIEANEEKDNELKQAF